MVASVWEPGDAIAARFDLSLNGLSALDHLVRQSISDINDAVLPSHIGGLRGMRPADWEAQRRNQEEYEERAAVMQLYAVFEGMLRRDAEWRGLEPTAHFHEQFSALALKISQQKFVRLWEWLACWRAVTETMAGSSSAHIATLSQLKTSFADDRNPLMHTDRALVPPLARVQQQLAAAYSSLCELAVDFGVCDAP